MVKGCKPREQASSACSTPFPILCSPCRFQPLAQMPSHCVPLCVRLCLTRRTSAQNTVSTARAASCLRKAGLPVQRALLQGCRCVSSAPARRIRTRLYSVKKRRELKYTSQRRHRRDLLLEYKQMWICSQPFFFPLFDWWHTAERSLSGKPRRPDRKRPSDSSRHETSRAELNSAETGG